MENSNITDRLSGFWFMISQMLPLVGFFLYLMLLIGALLLFPKTFLLGNILNAISIVIIMALAINAGSFKIAFMEIPFLLLPLVLIWLKYPFLKN